MPSKMNHSRRDDLILINIMCNFVRKNHGKLLHKHSPGRHPKKALLKLYQQLMLPVVKLQNLQESVFEKDEELAGEPEPECLKADHELVNHDLVHHDLVYRVDGDNSKNCRVFTEVTNSSQMNSTGIRKEDGFSEPSAEADGFLKKSRKGRPFRRASSEHSKYLHRNDGNRGSARACATIYKFLRHHKYLQSKLLSTYKLPRAKSCHSGGRDNVVSSVCDLPRQLVCRRPLKHKLDGSAEWSPSPKLVALRKAEGSHSTVHSLNAQLSRLRVGASSATACADADTTCTTTKIFETKPKLKDNGIVLDEGCTRRRMRDSAIWDQMKSNPTDVVTGNGRGPASECANEQYSIVDRMTSVYAKSVIYDRSELNEYASRLAESRGSWPALDGSKRCVVDDQLTLECRCDSTRATTTCNSLRANELSLSNQGGRCKKCGGRYVDDDYVLSVVHDLVEFMIATIELNGGSCTSASRVERAQAMSDVDSSSQRRLDCAGLLTGTGFEKSGPFRRRFMELHLASLTLISAESSTPTCLSKTTRFGRNRDDNDDDVRELMNDILFKICQTSESVGLRNENGRRVSESIVMYRNMVRVLSSCVEKDLISCNEKAATSLAICTRRNSDRCLSSEHRDNRLVQEISIMSNEQQLNGVDSFGHQKILNHHKDEDATCRSGTDFNSDIGESKQNSVGAVHKRVVGDRSSATATSQCVACSCKSATEPQHTYSPCYKDVAKTSNESQDDCYSKRKGILTTVAQNDQFLLDNKTQRYAQDTAELTEEVSSGQESKQASGCTTDRENNSKENTKFDLPYLGEPEGEDALPDIPPVTDDLCEEYRFKEKPKLRRKKKRLKFTRRKNRTQNNVLSESRAELKQVKHRRRGITSKNTTNQKKGNPKKRKFVQERRKLYPRRESIFYASDFLHKDLTNDDGSEGLKDNKELEDTARQSATEAERPKKRPYKKKTWKVEKNETAKDGENTVNREVPDSGDRLSIEFSNHNWFLEKYRRELQEDKNHKEQKTGGVSVIKEPVQRRYRRRRRRTLHARKATKSKESANDGSEEGTHSKGSTGNVKVDAVYGQNDLTHDLQILEVVSLASYMKDDSQSDKARDVKNESALAKCDKVRSDGQNRPTMTGTSRASQPHPQAEVQPIRSTATDDDEKPLDLSVKTLPLDLRLNARDDDRPANEAERKELASPQSRVTVGSYDCFNLPVPKSLTSVVPSTAPLTSCTSEHLPAKAATRLLSSRAVAPNSSCKRSQFAVEDDCSQAEPFAKGQWNGVGLPTEPQPLQRPGFACRHSSPANGDKRCSRGDLLFAQPQCVPQNVVYPLANKQPPLAFVETPNRVNKIQHTTEDRIGVLNKASTTALPPTAVSRRLSFPENSTYVANQTHFPPSSSTYTSPCVRASGQQPVPAVPYGSRRQPSGPAPWCCTPEVNGTCHPQQLAHDRSSQRLYPAYGLPCCGDLQSAEGQHQVTRFVNSARTTLNAASQQNVYPVHAIKCQVCNNKATFLCSGCKKVAYCSRRCQCVAWRYHRSQCPA